MVELVTENVANSNLSGLLIWYLKYLDRYVLLNGLRISISVIVVLRTKYGVTICQFLNLQHTYPVLGLGRCQKTPGARHGHDRLTPQGIRS